MKRLGLLSLSLALCARMSVAYASKPKTFHIDCDEKNGNTIAEALERAKDGDTISLSGTCAESVFIDKSITLDGHGSASLAPNDPDEITISMRGALVRVVGLRLESPARVQTGIATNNVISENDIGVVVTRHRTKAPRRHSSRSSVRAAAYPAESALFCPPSERNPDRERSPVRHFQHRRSRSAKTSRCPRYAA